MIRINQSIGAGDIQVGSAAEGKKIRAVLGVTRSPFLLGILGQSVSL